MSRAEMDKALERLLDFEALAPSEQWAIDKRLGILDWKPDVDETLEYLRLRAAKGDNSAARILWNLEARPSKSMQRRLAAQRGGK
jgi:hypothetical protein